MIEELKKMPIATQQGQSGVGCIAGTGRRETQHSSKETYTGVKAVLQPHLISLAFFLLSGRRSPAASLL